MANFYEKNFLEKFLENFIDIHLPRKEKHKKKQNAPEKYKKVLTNQSSQRVV